MPNQEIVRHYNVRAVSWDWRSWDGQVLTENGGNINWATFVRNCRSPEQAMREAWRKCGE